MTAKKPELRRQRATCQPRAARPLFDLYAGPFDDLSLFGDVGLHEGLEVLERHSGGSPAAAVMRCTREGLELTEANLFANPSKM
jgi:hypothetical protein